MLYMIVPKLFRVNLVHGPAVLYIFWFCYRSASQIRRIGVTKESAPVELS